MVVTFQKLMPHLLAWFAISLVLARGLSARRLAGAAGMAGFAAGAAAALFLFRSFPGDPAFALARTLLGGTLLVLWGVAVVSIYRSMARDFPLLWGERFFRGRGFAGACALAAGAAAGLICGCRLAAGGTALLPLVLTVGIAGILTAGAMAAERLIPQPLQVSGPALAAAVISLLLFSASSFLRLDLFSPLTMKVMKFAHDFVHQFMESMLIPDHFFVRNYLWQYIGLLFGKEVGFWGGLLIWFSPPLLILAATRLERLPSVAPIRQGAQRRKVLAAAIRARRIGLIVPLIALAVFAAAAYRSRFPAVEYWDPKPLVVTADQAGEIVIPKKGEIDLEDGKLHKFLYRQGGKEARFFVLMGPAGQLTVDLDACAICKPNGYGQADGTVICYYCATLIPLETVGKPGGCNPVPIPFADKADGVHIDGLTLINEWSNTVQSTTAGKGGGR